MTEYEVYDPSNGELLSVIKDTEPSEINQKIAKAHDAFLEWQNVSLIKRARVFFKFKELLETHSKELALAISRENGKPLDDAKAELQRGIEIVEHACAMPSLQRGSYSCNVGTNIDCYSIREPLGVCVGITPFNFPAMVPLWMIPEAIAAGNAFILKPSEKTPTAARLLQQFLTYAGLPDGLLQIVDGGKPTVEYLIKHELTKAISFVGSTQVAKAVYKTASDAGKRVQALAGAKNHCVIMPDANLQSAVTGIINAAFGAAGQRCMAISVVVTVGRDIHKKLLDLLIPEIPKIAIAPINNAELKTRIVNFIESGVTQGAKLLIDGREHELFAKPGFYVGPTIFDGVTTQMDIYNHEIFGPVLSIINVDKFEDACKLIDNHQYGNGAAIYTQSGNAAREFSKVKAGMIGINVPIPVPVASFGFGGMKESLFGDLNVYGDESVSFYTTTKKITETWPQHSENVDFVFN